MSAPTPFVPGYDYTAFQAAHPTTPLPADKIEIDLNAIQTTTDEIIENLGLIQRTDGKIANDSIGYDQLKDEVTLSINSLADWTTATEYVVSDTVYYGNNVYRCIVAHTSGVFATDLAANKWELFLNFNQFIVATEADLNSVESDYSAIEADAGAVEADLSAVEGDRSSVESTAAGLVASVEADLASVEADLVSTEADLTATEADLASVESDAGAVESDFLAVETDAGAVESDLAAVEADAASIIGKQTIFVPAGAMRPSATGGCAILSTIATSANQPDIQSLDFDTTTQEYAQFTVCFPKSWNESTVTAQFYWSHAATTTNFGVVWDLQGVATSDDDTIAVNYGTAQQIADTGGTTNDEYVTSETPAITIAGTPAVGDMVHFRVSRVTGDGSDTMAIDARLMGIKLYFTTDTGNDA